MLCPIEKVAPLAHVAHVAHLRVELVCSYVRIYDLNIYISYIRTPIILILVLV
jgi:hypothetical protein